MRKEYKTVEINWIWVIVSPLLQLLLTKFWQWVLQKKTIRLQIVNLYLTGLIISYQIKELPPKKDNK
ncbi:hypothetical protein C7B64_19450 [Merismopedia glauca CCAP 1448/3]|uniref:Uncharacterized protein n=1 Tax=Merismopedia glauca CCAP 1448/3 TaxID=1296344 RepID=A0A2T1BZ91_9CYAN|nr:hypothetical protein C7B64_19450 [Merismopedia glauca CCAP 1448/3]